MLKSQRVVLQINIFDQHLVQGSRLEERYRDATPVSYGDLLTDIIQKEVDSLRYRSTSGSVPTRYYLPTGMEATFLND